MTTSKIELAKICPELAEIISMTGGQRICVACSEGYDAVELNMDGVLSSVSGKPGLWCHSYEDAHWPCIDKNLEAIAATMLKLAEENERLRKLKKGKLQYPHDDLRFKVYDGRPERRRR